MGKAPFCIVSENEASGIAVDRGKRWRIGQKLTIAFWGKEARSRRLRRVRQKVKSYAKTWTEHANIRFVFVKKSHRAMIRIRFTGGGGPSSSSVGTDNRKIVCKRPTMNLGIDKKSTKNEIKRATLHEFGHMLGFRHEHSHPGRPFKWNKEAVYEDHRGRKSRRWVRNNIFRHYNHDQVQTSEFDPYSIMLYAIPPRWTYDTFSSKSNTQFSVTDIGCIEKMYPT